MESSVGHAGSDKDAASLKLKSHKTKYGFGRGNFRPLSKEAHFSSLKVEGNLPDTLNGLYLRNGTNSRFPVNGRPHMFDGDSMLHCIRIENGGVKFYNRQWVKPPRFTYNQAAGRDLYASFGDISKGGPEVFNKLVTINKNMASGVVPKLPHNQRDNPSTATCLIGDQLYAVSEVSAPFRVFIDPHTGRLQSGYYNDHKRETRIFSAHSRLCPNTGERHFFASSSQVSKAHLGSKLKGSEKAFCSYGVFDAKGRIIKSLKIPFNAPAPGFLHDYFLTENFAIVVDHSLRFDPQKLKFEGPYEFRKDMNLRFGVLKRGEDDPAKIRWFDAGIPGFCWHVTAGWEEWGPLSSHQLVLWLPLFDHYPSHIPVHLPEEPESFLTKVVLDLKTGSVTHFGRAKGMTDKAVERCDVNRNYFGKRQRYAYLMKRAQGLPMYEGFIKYDLIEEKIIDQVFFGEHCLGGECLFVANDNGDEDDGTLMDFIYDEIKETSEFRVYNAKTLDLMARVPLPDRVPFGVHGHWLSKEELKRQWVVKN